MAAVWNMALEQRRFAWRHRGRTVRSGEQCRHLTDARADLPWLADLPAQSAQQVLRQLDRAYDNWWNREHPAQAPTFRRRSGGLSVPFPGQAVQVRKRSRKSAEVRLPKLGWVRFRLSRPLGGLLRNATITKDALGWHVSFGVATTAGPALPNGLPGCGVDFGVACSAFVSDECGPRLLPSTLTAGQQRRLIGLERRKARQVTWAKTHNGGRYSNRVGRTISQIAKLRAQQARRRQGNGIALGSFGAIIIYRVLRGLGGTPAGLAIAPSGKPREP
jgi:putative transposase